MSTKLIKLALLSTIISISTLRVAAQQVEPSKHVKNQAPMERSLPLINALQPISFDYDYQKVKSLPKGKQYSLHADEVKNIASGLVLDQYYAAPKGKNSNDQVMVKTVDLEKLVPFIIKAIQEQQQEIEELKRLLATQNQKSSETK